MENQMVGFDRFFGDVTGGKRPHPWQRDLADDAVCENRLIRIPTGFGKTLGIVSAWLRHRVQLKNDDWPRRLVWCLPMRVLVEQTEREVRHVLASAGVLWDGGDHDGKVGVHLLMGGADAADWHLYPEECAVLIGTQDMLLSRAMNRGYGAPRARWPMEFGLLGRDSLWVMDEVQLMDVGLATSAQLQAFRDTDAVKSDNAPPCYTWWMSATLQPDWLGKSPDTTKMADHLSRIGIPASDRTGFLWDDVSKTCRRENIGGAADLADLVAREHADAGYGEKGPTLVVVNRVDHAMAVYGAICKDKPLREKGTDIRLVHSRFRPAERADWTRDFLGRDLCAPGTNRIIIATQVVEAGVDISAYLLITELAPWASLVQRFGRCARWGGEALVIVADLKPENDKDAAPYDKAALDAAREALGHLDDVAPRRLEAFAEANANLLPALYPYDPPHLLLRHELDELFDTSPDLSGADIDISRFIRSGKERDLHVFWLPIPARANPEADVRPIRDALCAVKFLAARDWLCGKETQTKKQPTLKSGMRAWVWDWLDGGWRPVKRADLVPGRTVLVDAGCGGYDPDLGWLPDSKKTVSPVPVPEPPAHEKADAALESESMSTARRWQTIAVHGREVGNLAVKMAETVAPNIAGLFGLAGRWHDAGKGHPAFNNSMTGADKPARADLAKAPKDAWLPVHRLYPMNGEGRRAGFRHELVSVLALFSVLQRQNPDHPALLGPWRELLTAAGFNPATEPASDDAPTSLEAEILDLDADAFNLLAYLICSHHGKVRLAWYASPADQSANDDRLRILGVKNEDDIPAITLVDRKGGFLDLSAFKADLSLASAGLDPTFGMGWTERTLKLMETHGPFTMAWMEAIFRAADQRASRLDITDDLLESEDGV